MFLTSHLAKLFTPSPAQQLAPANVTPSTTPFDAGGDGELREAHLNTWNLERRKYQNDMEEEEEEARPPYLHSMIAGGVGGTTGDLLMHSIDTVKTRQQGDPHIPPKYTSLSSTYSKIFRQEGVRRGLYGGVTPAFLGFLADLTASVVYVPSEVLKTRLQLQGRYNNPFFNSGYNYRSTLDATRTIVRKEGVSALFHGYKATILRDLPFSALQFAIYEQERKLAMKWARSRDIGIPLEIATAGTAGGMAGVITCPLDVVKTRIQTQINLSQETPTVPVTKPSAPRQQPAQIIPAASVSFVPSTVQPPQQKRSISTSSPNTTVPKKGSVPLNTSSVVTGLKIIYKSEGIAGCFRGVGPRFVWTSVQSSTMLVLYQMLLKQLEAYQLSNGEGNQIS